MVFAVRCPAAKCRKYMLVEDTDRGRTVSCLICKGGIKVPPPAGVTPPAATAVPATPPPSSGTMRIPSAAPPLPGPASVPAAIAVSAPLQANVPTAAYAPLDSGDESQIIFEPDDGNSLEPILPAIPVQPPGVPVAQRLPDRPRR